MPRAGGLTYTHLLAYPEDARRRRELFDGALVVTPTPHPRHQLVCARLLVRLQQWGEPLGWRFVGPLDLLISDRDVLEPDVVGFRPGHPFDFREQWVRVPPDLVVEVASPSTRLRDLRAKASRYAAFGVPEYWFLDHERDRLVVHRLLGSRYRTADLDADDVVASPLLPGFGVPLRSLSGTPR